MKKIFLPFLILCYSCIPIYQPESDLRINHNCTPNDSILVGFNVGTSMTLALAIAKAETKARNELLLNIKKILHSECRNIYFDNDIALAEYLEHCDSNIEKLISNTDFLNKLDEINLIESNYLEKLNKENQTYYYTESCCRVDIENFLTIINLFQTELDSLKEKRNN